MAEPIIKAAPQAQPTFPMATVAVNPQGVIIQFALAPGLTLTQAISEGDFDVICRQWLSQKQQLKRELKVIADVKKGR